MSFQEAENKAVLVEGEEEEQAEGRNTAAQRSEGTEEAHGVEKNAN